MGGPPVMEILAPMLEQTADRTRNRARPTAPGPCGARGGRLPCERSAGERGSPRVPVFTTEADRKPPRRRKGMFMAERRDLSFTSLEDVMAEVDRLLAGHETVGRWSLGQICNHLGTSFR